MSTQEIKKFIDLIKNTDIEELHWEQDDLKIVIKRQNLDILPVTEPQEKSSPKPTVEEKKLIPIKSPMVGIFRRAESNDHPPLVMEGNHVVPGQKVAVVEAMKIMKDVISSIKGKIVKILVENGQPVEFGQELFLVDPEEEV